MVKTVVAAVCRHFAPGACGLIVLGLLVATWTPASMATTACEELAANKLNYQTGVQTTDPMKAQDPDVALRSGSTTSVTVGWTIASNTPTGAISEWCVKKVHVSSALDRELCGSQTGITQVADDNCFGNDPTYGTALGCRTGSFKFSVQMRTNCGYDGPWVATDPAQINLE